MLASPISLGVSLVSATGSMSSAYDFSKPALGVINAGPADSVFHATKNNTGTQRIMTDIYEVGRLVVAMLIW